MMDAIDWIFLAEDKDSWWAVMKRMVKLQVS